MKLSVHAIPLQSALTGCQLPPGGSQGGGYEFALVHSDWYSAYRKPLRRDAPPQLCMKQLYAVKDGYTC